ncbi:MAG: hypothetical protein ACI4BD_08415 [Paludibacteraceae bacterium]
MKYNRVMLGKGGMFAAQCRQEGFIGVDFDIHQDISDKLYEQWEDASPLLVPLFLAAHPEKSRVAAGLSCGYLWTVCCWLKVGDIVLCPNGEGVYMVGEITSDYYYVADKNAILPHRRNVKWYEKVIHRSEMPPQLQHSTGSIGTCCDITKYANEIQSLLNGTPYIPSPIVAKNYQERALHKILCSYVRDYLGVFAKTIRHEISSNSKDKGQKWVHPDIIGVEFADVKTDTARSLMRIVNPDAAVTLYSFEMKKEIHTDYELKEAYFQALSNCSWANRGYLVAYEINETLREEMARLNNAFGIGIIRLQANNSDTEILFQAENKNLDFVTIDKLCNINADFKLFIEKVSKYLHAGKDYASEMKLSVEKICDEVFSNPNEVEDYCKTNNIPL